MSLIITPKRLIQRAELYHQLAALMIAGVGVMQALDMLQRNPPSFLDRRPLEAILARIREGATLGESLLGQGAWLPAFDLSLIQAAEQSGRLPECFRLLSNYYNERAQLVRSVINDLLYPLFIVHFAIAIFPTSQLVELVKTSNPIPYLQAKLILLGPAYAIGFLLIVAAQGRRGETWRALVEDVLRLFPVLGAARRNLALARLAASLEALVSAGVSVVEGWTLAAAASGSPYLKREVNSWKRRLQSGETPGEILIGGSGFPELFASLYHTGEVSGQLDDTLRRLHNHYQEEGSRKLRLVAKWVPILIYFLILITVAIQVISFWTNYYGNIFNQFGQ
jgi:type II secretory pathway component PulF